MCTDDVHLCTPRSLSLLRLLPSLLPSISSWNACLRLSTERNIDIELKRYARRCLNLMEFEVNRKLRLSLNQILLVLSLIFGNALSLRPTSTCLRSEGQYLRPRLQRDNPCNFLKYRHSFKLKLVRQPEPHHGFHRTRAARTARCTSTDAKATAVPR